MAKIVLSMDGVILEEMMLSKERITIGRRPHNDLVIDNSAISAEHAVIVTMLHDAFLEDLNSTNGTRVNGQPVKKHFLKNNDVIELAKYKLRFVGDSSISHEEDVQTKQARRAKLSLDKTLRKVAGEESNDFSNADTEIMLGFAATAYAIVKILSGPDSRKEIPLTKPLTTVGVPGVQVAVITRRGQKYSVTHVEGAAYPSVNGKTIGASAYLLAHGDVIDLAGMKMEFHLSEI
jgi:hypothetical protein